MKKHLTRLLIAVVAFAFCGGPQAAHAFAQQSTATSAQGQDANQTSQLPSSQDATTSTPTTEATAPAQTSQDAAQQPATQPQRQVIGPDGTLQRPAADQNRGTTVDPSAGPLTPNTNTLPNAPSTQQPAQAAPQPTTELNQRPAPARQEPSPEPLGTAAAEGIRTTGVGGSKPAGSAIAPAKQKQTRSLLIKVGLVAAAGAALGIVYGLSRGTPSTPPNTR